MQKKLNDKLLSIFTVYKNIYVAFLFYDFFLLSSVSNESGAKNPEKLFENWKLGFPIGAVPTMDHSKLDLIGVLNSFNRYSSIKNSWVRSFAVIRL